MRHLLWISVLAMVLLVGWKSTEATTADVSNFRLPLNGSFEISQGPRCSYSHSSGRNLEAIDFDTDYKENYPVYASESGYAYYINEGDAGGGNVIVIIHDNGNLKSVYAHLNEPNTASNFQSRRVEKGEEIGKSGNTGNSDGPHLHWAVVEEENPAATTNGTPVEIWQLPGFDWWPKDVYKDSTYPAPPDWCIADGENDGTGTWPPPGVKSLIRSEFTVERTNPSLSEEIWFSTRLENNGEVPVYLRTVFLRLKRGEGNVEAFGLQSNQGTVSILPGESKLFDLRAPPITEPGLWRIDKVEAEDTSGHWFELGVIASHLMVGYPNLIKDHPATASSVNAGSGNVAQRANDGNMRTRWESEYYDPQWIEFDLDYEQMIDRIIVRSEIAFQAKYKVKIKKDGDWFWTTVNDWVVGIPDNSNYISIDPQLARKIRFEFEKRGTVWGDSIWEIEVYNLTGDPIGDPMPTPTPTPIVCGSGSTNSNNPLDCATSTPIPPTFTPIPGSTSTPNPTSTPTHTPQPNPTATPTSGPVDTTPPEVVEVINPVNGQYLDGNTLTVTGNVKDHGSGLLNVIMSFHHDGAWENKKATNVGNDQWQAVFNIAGLSPQSAMMVVIWAEDVSGNGRYSEVRMHLTNERPSCSLEWHPDAGSIHQGFLKLNTSHNWWWRAVSNGETWVVFESIDHIAQADISLPIVAGESVTHLIEVLYPFDNGRKYCELAITVDNSSDEDVTPPEGHITTPADGTFMGTGWYNVTADVTDSQSGIKKVEFHFWHDGAWHMVEDWYEADGWSASFNLTGFQAQNDMKLLLHMEDNAGNRAQSSVVSGLTNVTPSCSLTWVPKPGSINSGNVELTANYNGMWKATVDGQPWTTFNVNNGTAIGAIDFTIVSGQLVVYVVEMWFPNNDGAQYCRLEVTIDNQPSPTNTPTPTASSTNTPVPTATLTPTTVPSYTHTPTPTASNTSTPTMTPTPSCSMLWIPNPGSKNVGVIQFTANPNGWWKATINGNDWTDVYIENSAATKDKSFEYVAGEITHHLVEMWYPNEGGSKRCGMVVEIDDYVKPTVTPTPTPTPFAGEIYGTIVDENGQPVFGVDVQLWRDTQEQMYWSQWVENGEYRFYGLPDSTWTVKIISPGDPDYWTSVEPKVVVISDAQRVYEVNFKLTRTHQTYQIFLPLVLGQ